jgi:hypothetical protein
VNFPHTALAPLMREAMQKSREIKNGYKFGRGVARFQVLCTKVKKNGNLDLFSTFD